MGYVLISGNQAAIQSMHSIEEIVVMPRSATQKGPDLWEVSAYCSDAAIPLLTGLGLTVTVLATSAETDQHISSIEDDSDGTLIV